MKLKLLSLAAASLVSLSTWATEIVHYDNKPIVVKLQKGSERMIQFGDHVQVGVTGRQDQHQEMSSCTAHMKCVTECGISFRVSVSPRKHSQSEDGYAQKIYTVTETRCVDERTHKTHACTPQLTAAADMLS